jgi:hypothetical protein
MLTSSLAIGNAAPHHNRSKLKGRGGFSDPIERKMRLRGLVQMKYMLFVR